MNYLDNGGNLYIESVNIGSDYDSTAFFDYLGITLKGDGDEYEVSMVQGKPYQSDRTLSFYYLGGFEPHFNVDRLGNNGNAVQIFSSDEGNARSFINPTGNYNVVSSSVLIGAMANGDSLNFKPYFISELVNYFIGYNPVTALLEHLGVNPEIKTWPNPAVDRLTVELPSNMAHDTRITIHDNQGKMVAHGMPDHDINGKFRFEWNCSDYSGRPVPAGLYLIHASDGKKTLSAKVLINR
ncbi:MAG: hypothetical protein Kow00127_10860 [Bacteroidales bacterium]